MQREREEEERKALKAVVEHKKTVKAPETNNEDFSSVTTRLPARMVKADSEVPDIVQIRNQIQMHVDFDKLRNSVEKDVMSGL